MSALREAMADPRRFLAAVEAMGPDGVDAYTRALLAVLMERHWFGDTCIEEARLRHNWYPAGLIVDFILRRYGVRYRARGYISLHHSLTLSAAESFAQQFIAARETALANLTLGLLDREEAR